MVKHTQERSACGVGFVVSREGRANHGFVQTGLRALHCMEHRGAVGADGRTGDGAGIMTEIPFDLLGATPGTHAVATLFVSSDPSRRRQAMRLFREVFAFESFTIADRRTVPVETDVLGPQALARMPSVVQVVLARPPWVRTEAAFNAQLYFAQQRARSRLRSAGLTFDLHFASLSTRTVVYKALTRAVDLAAFYPDLRDPAFVSRFALFHRRFSTNTATSWDRAQPFRLIAHNGEINTIAGNRSWSYAREQSLGLPRDELLTHGHTSDSGSLNQQVEALRYRSSMPNTEDILAILIPPADKPSGYTRFWGRAMEPWDGPAFVTYADGEAVGARLDRNGFRPCRWAMTDDAFFLASEAGIFGLAASEIIGKGTLNAGCGVRVNLNDGEVHFRDPSHSRENRGARFEPRLAPLPTPPDTATTGDELDEGELRDRFALHGVTRDELDRVLAPLIATGKEPIGSMGDTAQPAVLSATRRSLYDFLFQDFAQVTNPPLDYLRERMVTELHTVLGRTPNIFAPKELLPAQPGWLVASPVLSLAQAQVVRNLDDWSVGSLRIHQRILDATFPREGGVEALEEALDALADAAVGAVHAGAAVLVISDTAATWEQLPMPSLLALRAVVNRLNREGLRLHASLVLEAGDLRGAHAVACAIGFGATAVAPHLAQRMARARAHRSLGKLTSQVAEAQLNRGLEGGLLKVMSKVGISVVRSYQSSKLYTPLGLDTELVDRWLPGLTSPVSGLQLSDFAAAVLARSPTTPPAKEFRFKEHGKEQKGERHAMTAGRSRVVHALVADDAAEEAHAALWQTYLDRPSPARLSHLLAPRPARQPVELADVEPASAIVRRFGSGAMSFGALSAISQRDLFVAMRRLGARSNSGEGGENPYYYVDGTCASTKQVASGRFGVTAEYLVSGREIEIKMAQGAKPGEGGQLMGVKVSETIARARHASPGVALISPPPQHDIYSIEDLRQLIDELRELSPGTPVVVKLVAGKGVGTVAAGVVKAGADVVQISGGSGGTGAATLSSMTHAGLPWEIGLVEVHQTLVSQGLRRNVTLRVDGGLHTGADIAVAAALGAEEFGFGKLLLVAQGCIMARVCESNRCPRGITTHAERFLAKYVGTPEHVVRLLTMLAEDVRTHLAAMGLRSLGDAVGQTGLLRADPRYRDLVATRGLDLSWFLAGTHYVPGPALPRRRPRTSPLGERVALDCGAAVDQGTPIAQRYAIQSTDRAVLTRLAGDLARRSHQLRMQALREGEGPDHRPHTLPDDTVDLRFEGSAGQGFGAFLVAGVRVTLVGEANDHVCKGISGGDVAVLPPDDARYVAEDNAIVGNGALYGATGGRVWVRGVAGDRFAVRNSGASAVVEGVGLHACEYMTAGVVVVLGATSANVGAGMTGGTLYVRDNQVDRLNDEYVVAGPVGDDAELRGLVEAHAARTGSATAVTMLADWRAAVARMRRCTAR